MIHPFRRPLPALVLIGAATLAFACADGCDCGGETPPPAPEAQADTGTSAQPPAPRPTSPPSPEPPEPVPSAPTPIEDGSAEGSFDWTAGESTAPTVTPPSPQLQLRRFDPSSTPSRLDPRAVRPQVRDLRLSPGPINP